MNIEHYLTLAKSNTPFKIDDSWAQGRSIFGGLSAALVLAHIEAQIEESTGLTDKDLRTLNVHFCGAITADENCEFKYEILSQGKSIYQIQGQLIQDGQVKTQVLACFGLQRNSSIHISHAKLETVKAASDGIKFPFIEGLTPNFVQNIDVRATSKNFPFSGSANMQVNGYMRFEEAPTVFNDAAILALIDAWPPAILPMLKKPAPASTVTWNIEFVQPRNELKQDDYLYYQCDVVQADLGYGHTEAKIFHPNGELVALSRQLVVVYDQK